MHMDYRHPMTLDERVAVIAGATGGLGRVVARALAEEGASLALLGTDAGRLQALVDELALPPERCLTAIVDLRDTDATERVVGDLGERLGSVDVLAQLVGGYVGGTPLVDVDRDELSGMLDQHVWTTFNLIRSIVPRMKRGGWGRLVAVTSAAVPAPGAGLASYAATKAAQETLILSLARDLAGSGVTANLLSVKSIDVDHSGKAGWTTPEQIAAAIVWLCSDDAGVVSGARIPLFGG
jgi:NAD(P)-dependent dehydrogenase (short-subunit alcohol dehydrogenase family)